ncbi:MAG TPA: amidohydrolase family protein [Acidimicrobiia bacterium]|nr:amidohydrolase family protein [Acidimicrobiia bacterium]
MSLGGAFGRIVDTMVGLPPAPGDDSWRDQLRPLLKDRESLEGFAHPASYMFKHLPDARFADDPIGAVLAEMDRFGVERALVPISEGNEPAIAALGAHPDRILGSFDVDPGQGVGALTTLRRAVEDWGVVAATGFAAGTFPQRAYDDAAWFPVYATCVELGIPIFLTVGVPGPRVPFSPQRVDTLDVVCYEFPDLVVVMRHGAEPWADLAVKLMLKWPGLHYSTSAFAPRYYPTEIVDFANTRGADKILFAGYFPMGLSYETIFDQLARVPLREQVWEPFLHGNARRILRLDG